MIVRCAGLDIGSRSIELVVVDDGEVELMRQADTGHDPLSQAENLLAGVSFDRILATGYGRGLMEVAHQYSTVTEIKAYAAGAHWLFPGVRTVIDVGGQDSKVIALDESGRVRRFEMNDRCAAGSGRFLEVMAAALGYAISDFGVEALQATESLRVSAMCAVFAESEVTSLLHKGVHRRSVARGVHESIVQRLLSMAHRVSIAEPLVLAGGVARNPCVVRLLEDALHTTLLLPAHPHMVGALGAARLAADAA